MNNQKPITIDLADRADRAVRQLFGHDAPLTHSVSEITDTLRSDIQRIRSGQSAGPATLALVGRVGEGKSWLTRAFLAEGDAANQMIQSGQNAAERSMELTWIGSQQPFSELTAGERFIKTSPQNMLDLGAPYVLADSPGYSDHNPSLEALSSVALASSNIKLLATSVSNIRDSSLASFIGSMDGSLILPIVRFRNEDDTLTPSDSVRSDCLTEMQDWAAHAPSASILPAIFIPDAGIAGNQEARTTARQLISAALTPLLADPATLAKHRESQLQQRIQLTRSHLSATLTDFRQRIGTPVEKLDQLSATLPEIVQKEVIGDTAQLHIGIRSRFRADAIERTPALLFPYRSLIGILGLTHGAWDKLIFTTLGSVPSLVMTAFHSVKSWSKTKNYEQTLRDQSRQRLNSLINDAYREDIKNFSYALTAITDDTDHSKDITLNEKANVIEIQGLTGLEIEAHEIIANAIKKRRISGLVLWLGGILAFTVFWAMLLGPAIALYTDYFISLSKTAKSFSENWEHYPKPPASLWLTSFMLSMIPAGIISMIVMYLTCRRGRVTKTSTDIESEIASIIRNRIDSDKLRLVINNPKLDAAKTLLSMSREK
ncbi:MAG: hypothetical protein ACI9E1_001475 [Cryomorphaceae bacterium]|jgi:hypothetical protein